MFERALKEIILQQLNKQQVEVILGARRVGKTILLEQIKADNPECLWFDGDDPDVQKLLEPASISNYKRLIEPYSLLIIDEAQYIPQIGQKVKLMIDHIKPLNVILTGSSSFDLYQQGEPLVGRSYTYYLYPMAQMEMKENPLETRRQLADRLVYGSYPTVLSFSTIAEKKTYLLELVNTYLLKDILAYQDVRQPQKLRDLLMLLAYQIGHEVSLNELSNQLGINKQSVERYLDLLSKVFIIYKRAGYSNNLRKEVTKSSRWYFYDNGVRNAVINSFAPMALRNDVGALWENYILSERLKRNAYYREFVNNYFWRTYDGQEIDLIEEQDSFIKAYECKWKEEKAKVPVAFRKAYPDAPFEVIQQQNYLDWII